MLSGAWVQKAELQARIAGIRSIGSKEELILEACADRTVLDVGCVGQARASQSEHWLHAKLRTVARAVTGVDINREGVLDLRRRGFQVSLPEELGDQQFDRVVMGDVIEHVDNPVEFLRHYSGHLAPNGRILVSTPNAFSAIQFLAIATGNRAWVNPEHVCYFDPVTLSEVAERAGLEVTEFSWIKTERRSRLGAKGRVFFAVGSAMQRARPYLAEDFFFELARADDLG